MWGQQVLGAWPRRHGALPANRPKPGPVDTRRDRYILISMNETTRNTKQTGIYREKDINGGLLGTKAIYSVIGSGGSLNLGELDAYQSVVVEVIAVKPDDIDAMSREWYADKIPFIQCGASLMVGLIANENGRINTPAITNGAMVHVAAAPC